MNVDVAFLPRDISGRDLSRLAVVVLDVLRATTSITAALAAGVSEIHVFGDIAAAEKAAQNFPPNRLLCGEVNCLPPRGFDLGNSPRAFNRTEHAGRPMLLSTTNGTRALLAAAGAGVVLCGALVNAWAVAKELISLERDALLLCAGTEGAVAMEDILGAGAVIEGLEEQHEMPRLASDAARITDALYRRCLYDLPPVLEETVGGRKVIAAGVANDIRFCANLNKIPIVGRATGTPPVIRPI